MIFEALDGSVIIAAALQTSGAAGPPGIDAYGRERLCSSFKSASDKLRCSIVVLAQCLCTSLILLIIQLLLPFLLVGLLLWIRIQTSDLLVLVRVVKHTMYAYYC